MTFKYRSSRGFDEKELNQELVGAIREHLVAAGFSRDWDLGQLQDSLMEFRHNGRRYMINQLEPVFIHLARYGELWRET